MQEADTSLNMRPNQFESRSIGGGINGSESVLTKENQQVLKGARRTQSLISSFEASEEFDY